MFLVDTSVWLDYLRGILNEPVAKFRRILDQGYSFGITSQIYQEVLQGSESDVVFGKLDRYLRRQVFYHPLDPVDSYAEAAMMYSRCRRAGITIRSTIDCLIAQVAIENDLLVLHNDRDFGFIARIVPELKIA